MDLFINSKAFLTPIQQVLDDLQKSVSNGLLRDVGRENNNNIPITCIVHKGGRESRPSCNVYCSRTNPNVEYGKVHCFTCGYTASLPKFVGDCFGKSEEFGKSWLCDNYGLSQYESADYLMPIELGADTPNKTIDESVLAKYHYYHPYMWERGLSKEVVDKFSVGYDDENKAITFPVWDDKGKLVMVTSRSVLDKRFHIDKDADKPVYLLNHIIKNNIQTVYVTESQINALTLWSWGYPAIALFGTGSAKQYDILNRCGVRQYILCFDGDTAGDKGRERFMGNIRNDVLVSYKSIPRGKDVNDLSKEVFDKLPEVFW